MRDPLVFTGHAALLNTELAINSAGKNTSFYTSYFIQFYEYIYVSACSMIIYVYSGSMIIYVYAGSMIIYV